MNKTNLRALFGERWLVAGLLLTSAVPTLAGMHRLSMIAGVVGATNDSARLLVFGPPLALHIASTCAFLLVGAFQVAPRLREGHPRLHRMLGFAAAPAGLLGALSGIWLALNVAPGPYDGRALFWMRMIVGATMTVYLGIGIAALRARSYATHGAFMIRAYALALGAGTQVFTHVGLRLVGASLTTESRTFAMGAGWLLNVLVGEWIIRTHVYQQARPRVRASARSGVLLGAVLGVLAFFAREAVAKAEAPADAGAPDAPTKAADEVPAATAPPVSPPIVAPSAAPAVARAPAISPPVALVTARATEKSRQSPGSGIVGLRVTYVRSDSPAGRDDAVSAGLGGHLEAHNDEWGIVAYRGRLDFSLGGGTGGVDGVFGGALLVGLRLPITAHHAPFVRLGLAGEFGGNDRYLYSRFDLPLTEIGHQYVDDDVLLEIGLRGSPVLAGRFRSNAEARELSSSFSVGAFATAQLDHARFDVLYTRIAARDGFGRGVDTFQGLGCVLPGTWFALCVDGQLVSTDIGATSAGGANLTSGFLGGMLAVGRVNGSPRH